MSISDPSRPRDKKTIAMIVHAFNWQAADRSFLYQHLREACCLMRVCRHPDRMLNLCLGCMRLVSHTSRGSVRKRTYLRELCAKSSNASRMSLNLRSGCCPCGSAASSWSLCMSCARSTASGMPVLHANAVHEVHAVHAVHDAHAGHDLHRFEDLMHVAWIMLGC